jgi:hypothetical protein
MRFRNLSMSILAMLALSVGALLPGARAASLTIPAGTTVTVRLADTIGTDRSHPGETFRAKVDAPVLVNGRVAVPQGAEAIGRITSVNQPGRFRGRPVLLVELTALNFNGQSIPLLTSSHQEAGNSRGKQTALYTGGGAAVGTVVAMIATGGVAILLGPTIGAAGGAAVQIVRGAQPLRIPAESLMQFTVQSPVALEAAY